MASTKRAHESSESDDNSNSDGVYEVERILAQETLDGEVFYLVKWEGYEDKECTWEPAENFENQRTIVEWQRQLAKGDTLDDEFVAHVQRKMDEFQAAEQERLRRERESHPVKATKKRKGTDDASHLSKVTCLVSNGNLRTTKPESTLWTAGEQPAIQDQPALPPPTFSPLYNLAGATDGFPISQPKVLAPAVATGTDLTNTSKRRRSAVEGKRFKNLRHMNNAQKSAMRNEIPPDPVNLISPADLSYREPAHVLPAATALPTHNSPLFFTERRSASAEPTLQSTISSQSSLIGCTKPPTLQDERSITASSAQASEGRDNASGKHAKIKSRKTGREWDFEEVLVQLSLGEHQVGDVKIAGLPPWLRRLLIDLKDNSNLRLHFEQPMVVTREAFQSLSAGWPPSLSVKGEVFPFEDTKLACDSLASYFEQHDVAALWAHPDPEISSITLILYSSSLPKWREASLVAFTSHMPRLLLGVRNRALKDEVAPPLMPVQPWQAFASVSLMTDIPAPRQSALTYVDTLQAIAPRKDFPSASQGPTPEPGQQLSPNIASIPLACTGEIVPRPEDRIAIPPPPRVLEKTKKASIPSVEAKQQTQLRNDEPGTTGALAGDSEQKVEVPVIGMTRDEGAEVGSTDKDVDWTCDLDHRAMIADTNKDKRPNPFVYIAFGHESPIQATAIKDWAVLNFTKDRLIFVEGANDEEWTEFCEVCGKSPGIALFGDERAFCKLPGLGNLLGKMSNISYFSLSWDQRLSDGHSTHYTHTKIFPHGTVILLTEAALRQPSAALDILSWFEEHSKLKTKSWKIMLRPNIRAWLEVCAGDTEADDVGTQYMDLLVQIHKLSSVVDVTVPSTSTERIRFLESLRASKTRVDFIIPMPALPNYDCSSSADDSASAVAERDEILLRHFVGWSTMMVASHRRFMVIDNDEVRENSDKSIYDSAHHIVFRSAEQFRREVSGKGKKEKKDMSKKAYLAD